MEKLRLGFLASHGGSNVQAIVDAYKNKTITASPEVIITNNSTAHVLERAREQNIPGYYLSSRTHPLSEELDFAILNTLQMHNVNLVILAGYMKKLGAPILHKYKNRILNIHPALLPKYGGQGMYGIAVHQAVLDAHEKITGATVHLVDEHYDNGRIVAQSKVEVLPDDTAETLGQRVLQIEHILLLETIRKISTGEIVLD